MSRPVEMTKEVLDILIVDDNPLLVSVLAEILKECGHTVRIASEGFAALSTIRERVPDVLLSDLNMPQMSGFELLSVVRRRFPEIAVIAMSGAYTGKEIPHGVAADAFYAKGSSSVVYVLEILKSFRERENCRSKRANVPVWITLGSTDQDNVVPTSIACPECLRTFYSGTQHLNPSNVERLCPHCRQPVQLAIVRATNLVDETCLPESTLGTGVQRRHRHSEMTPFSTERDRK